MSQRGLNKLFLIGAVTDVDTRRTGAAMIFVRTDDSPDKSMRNAAAELPAFLTRTFAVRVPRYVVERTNTAILAKGAIVQVDGHMQGVRRNIDGRDFYFVEAVADRIEPFGVMPVSAEDFPEAVAMPPLSRNS